MRMMSSTKNVIKNAILYFYGIETELQLLIIVYL